MEKFYVIASEQSNMTNDVIQQCEGW